MLYYFFFINKVRKNMFNIYTMRRIVLFCHKKMEPIQKKALSSSICMYLTFASLPIGSSLGFTFPKMVVLAQPSFTYIFNLHIPLICCLLILKTQTTKIWTQNLQFSNAELTNFKVESSKTKGSSSINCFAFSE